ncbi:hypothetical protein [Advenella sp. FME57]|uniref:hypothetical protein n=1 Tax=Advenella sp. FME57 TaxID=2742604 RepID=UPI001866FE18|nr:hypothetical protein [Advenella sp. FME57]
MKTISPVRSIRFLHQWFVLPGFLPDLNHMRSINISDNDPRLFALYPGQTSSHRTAANIRPIVQPFSLYSTFSQALYWIASPKQFIKKYTTEAALFTPCHFCVAQSDIHFDIFDHHRLTKREPVLQSCEYVPQLCSASHNENSQPRRQ